MGKILTVIVPSYNMERYLPKCLGSLVVADSALQERLEVPVDNGGAKDRMGGIDQHGDLVGNCTEMDNHLLV